MPIVREADGLAMSSRNAYLSPEQRQSALCLSRAIHLCRELYAAGMRDVAILRRAALELIEAEPAAIVDYLDFRDGTTLEPVITANDTTLLALAVRIGTTRLIDNTLLGDAS
jgi:pantoate--beta-alanine ligase